MRSLATLLFLITLVLPAQAASKDQLAGALAEYDRYKARVLKDLQHVDALRAQHSRTNTDLLPLFKKIAKAAQDANQLYHDHMLMEMMSGRPHALSRLLFTLHVALEQLAKMLTYEITYQSDQEWPFVLSLRMKAEETFRLADQELAGMGTVVQMR